MIRPLIAGNACRLHTVLPAGAVFMRILRRTADAFLGATDTGADLVVDSFAEDSFVDMTGLVNGTTYYYHCYDWRSGGWVDSGPTFAATPNSEWIDDNLDPQELVRNRIALGLASEIARGNLHPPSGAIQVTTAPFSLPDIAFPTVSVHMESTGPADRSIGDELEDFYDVALNGYVSTEGWLARYSLTIAGVSLNADERLALRKALRRVVQVNLPIFADAGLALIEFQQTDSEQFSENNAPLYVTSGAFSCVAAAYIRGLSGALSDVTVTERSINPLTGAPYDG